MAHSNSASGPPPITHLAYRPDIDGIRAVAVLSVVCYHAYPQKFFSGFIGVDIFFVISGFLITTILLGGLQKRQFNLLDFYDRRIRRIFPTLLAMLACCWAIGWFALLSDEFLMLGKHIVAGSMFLSNIVLWTEHGYFSASSDSKPLLHLWSLGIEEQFYIFWPVLLYLAWRLRLPIAWLIAGLFALSFSINLFMVERNPTATFYAPYTRAWELLIGAGLAYASIRRPRWLTHVRHSPWQHVLATLGLLAWLAGFLWIHDERAFPGAWALLPTVGAALIIAAGPGAWLNRRVLSWRPLVWVGLISFPLYLWHWPALVFLRLLSGHLTLLDRLLMMLLCVGVSWLCYQWLERPMRKGHDSYAKAIILAALMVGAGLVGVVTYMTNGLDGHGYRQAGKNEFAQYFDNTLPEWRYFQRQGIMQAFRDECNFYDTDRYREGKATLKPRDAIAPACHQRSPLLSQAVLIWGDSHAQQLYSGLRHALPADWQLLQVASSGCSPRWETQDSASLYCQRSNWFAGETVRQTRPDVVLLAQSANHQADVLVALAEKLRKLGVKKVLLVGPAPHWRQALPKLVIRKWWSHTPERTWEQLDGASMRDNDALRVAVARQRDAGIVFVDLLNILCNSEGCLTRIGADRKTGATSWDAGHLTPVASEYVALNGLAQAISGQPPVLPTPRLAHFYLR